MPQNIIQSSFATGELSPTLLARVDLTKYHTGCAVMRNFFVDYRSGTSTRPGTKFCNQAYKSATPVRVIPFQTSALTPYIIEFGDHYARFFSFGAPVLESSFAVSAASQASPCQITVTGNNFAVGDWIYLTGIGGMAPLNSRAFFLVTAVSGALVTLADTTGIPINSVGFPAYTSGGTAQRIYTIASPYAAADLALLKYVQVTNTMYITHPSYPPTTLIFSAPTSWSFVTMSFGTTISAPTGLSASATTGTGAYFSYIVTAVDNNGQESLPSTALAVNNVVNILSTQGTISLSWSAVPGAVSYNVYRTTVSTAGAVPSGSAYGFQQSVTGTQFADSNVEPDFSQGIPVAHNPFTGTNYPATCCFFQQRLYFGGSNAFPQTFWASQPGLYTNFNVSDPTQPDDELEDTLVSRQVNLIKNMIPMPGGLVMFTAQGAWQLSSGGGLASTSAVTPLNATAQTQTYNGSSDLPPIPINWAVLYPQLDGAVIELNYNIYAAIYTGQDISVLSNHLFFGYTLKEWAYAQKPFKVIWTIRNDGAMLSLTYVKEQEMVGWARHDTYGKFMSVATVLENQYDATYVVAQRFINGFTNQYIERLDDRVVFPYGAEDAWCVDCGLKTTLSTPSANLAVSSSAQGSTATLTANAAVFGSAQVGDVVRVDGGIISLTTILTSQVVQGLVTQALTTVVPDDPNNTPFSAPPGQWTLARPGTTFTGLDHLNGTIVSILADGAVQAPQLVVAGTIVLQNAATKVLAGIGFTAQMKTMPLDLGNERDTIQGKRKKVNQVSLRVKDTRGLQFGNDFVTMFPIKEMNPSVIMNTQIPLVTNDEWIFWDPSWNIYGQMCFQVTDPLPATILGVIPDITIGDK